jgi:hypothetical protein
LTKDAWLTATKHNRPGMKQGVPLEDAERKAGELVAEIRRMLAPMP